MRRLRFWINVTLLVVPVGLLGTGAFLRVRSLWNYFNTDARLAGLLSTEATRALGREVLVRDVKFRSSAWWQLLPNRVELSGISLAQYPTVNSALFAHADKVVIWYDLHQILFANDVKTPYVSEVQVIGPQVALSRDAQGRWNFEQIFKPTGATGRPFTDKISFSRASLTYSDQSFPRPAGVPKRFFATRLQQVAGVVLIRPDKSVAFDVQGKPEPVLLRDFHVTGIANLSPLRIDARLVATHINLPMFAHRFLPPNKARLLTGIADVDVSALYAPPAHTALTPFDVDSFLASLDAHGAIDATGISLTSPQLEGLPQHVSVKGAFTTDSFSGSIAGQYAGVNITTHGEVLGLLKREITPQGKTRIVPTLPTLALQGQASHADIAWALKDIHLERLLTKVPADIRTQVVRTTGQVRDLQFQIVGTLDNPTVSAAAHIDRLRSYGYEAENIDARALLANRVVTAEVKGKVEGGDAQARARVLTQEPGTFDVETHGRNVHLAALSPLLKRGIEGQGEFDLALRGRRGQTPFISAQAQAFDIKLNNQTFQSAYARAATVGRQLVVRTIRLDDPKGFALASGKIDLTTLQLNLNVAADNLDLAAILKAAQITQEGKPSPLAFPQPAPSQSSLTTAQTPPLFDLNALKGQGFFRGRLEGTLKNPELSGRATAYGVQAGAASLDRVQADISVSRDALLIGKGVAERYPGKMTISGVVSGLTGGDPEIDVKAAAQNLDIPDILRLAGLQNIPCTRRQQALNPQPPAKRPLDDYLILGSLTTTPITLHGKLKSLTLAEPVTVTGNGVTVNGLPVENLHATATLTQGDVRIPTFAADIAGGTITASGSVTDLLNRADGELKNAALDLSVDSTPLDVGRLTDALPPQLLTYNVGGTLALHAKITGTAANPTVQASADARKLIVSDDMNRILDIGNVLAQARYADKRVAIQSASVNEAGIPAGAKGQIEIEQFTYDPQNKAINGVVRWNSLQFQRMRELFAKSPFAQEDIGKQIADALGTLTRPLGGSITGQARISGTLPEPTADITFNASGIRIEDREITSVVGSLLADKHSLRIPSPSTPEQIVHLQSPDVDIDVPTVSAVFNGGALSADVRANKINLAIARQFFPPSAAQDLDRAQLVQTLNNVSGGGTAEFVASGTTTSPIIDASIYLRDVKYKTETINRIDIAHLTAREGKIETDSIELEKTKNDPNTKEILTRLEATANGSIDFSWKPPFIKKDAKIDLVAEVPQQDLSVLAVFGSDLNITSDGKFSLRAHVSNTLDDYHIFGALKLDANKLQFGTRKTGLYRTGLKDIHAEIDFKDDRVEVRDGFTARTQVFGSLNKLGIPTKQDDPKQASQPIHLTGGLPLKGRSQQGIDLVAEHVVFDENPLPGSRTGSVKGEADFNLHLLGSLNRPTLGGMIALANTTIAPPGDFGGGEGGALALPINPRFDLQVRLGKNVRLNNPQLQARAEGTISITGPLLEDTGIVTAPQPADPATLLTPNDPAQEANTTPQRLGLSILGKLTIPEGQLSLPTARFKIVPPAQLTLTYPTPDASANGVPTLGVDVDLKAQSRLTATSQSGQRKLYTVTVTARGPVTGATLDPITGESRLALNFTTSPNDLAGSQQALQQRLAGVLGGDALGQFGRNPGQVLAQQLTNVFTSSVIPNVFDQFARATGFEEFSINYDPVQRLNLIISRQIVGPFYVTYNRTLGTTPEVYNLKLSLRFKNNYQFSYDVDEQHTQRYLFEGVFRF